MSDCLENWQKWLQERERLQSYLAKCLNRLPGDLVMNMDEDVRKVLEEKTLIQYSKIKTGAIHDFWNLPPELFDKHDPCGRSYVFKTKTLADKGIVPELELIGIPKRILEEKHIYPRTRSLWTQWNNLQYRKLRMKDLGVKLEKLQPHRPDFTDLIVLGNKAKIYDETQLQKNLKIDAPIKEMGTTTDEQLFRKSSMKTRVLQKVPEIPLLINYFEFRPNELSTTKTFLLSFTSDVNARKCTTKYLLLENRSKTPIKLKFHQISPYHLFHDIIPFRKQGIAFFFERSDLILTPGLRLEMPFRFKTTIPGSYSETWEIYTKPKLWHEPAKVFLKLKGFAEFTSIERCREIARDLKRREKLSLVKDTISSILENVNAEVQNESIAVVSYYEEAKIFETVNTQLTPYKTTPKYKYNKIIIEKLKQIYDSVNTDSTEWNYNIEDLRSLVQDTEKLQEFEEVINHLETKPTYTQTTSDYRIFFSFLNSAITRTCNEIHILQQDLGVIFQPRYPLHSNRTSIEKRSESKKKISKCDTSSTKLPSVKSLGVSSNRLSKKGSVDSRSRKSKNSMSLEKSSEDKRSAIINIPDYLKQQYNQDLYTIFYTNLCKAIDAIEIATVSLGTELPHRSLQRIEESNSFQEQFYSNTEININSLISEILQIQEPQKPIAPATEQISYPETIFLQKTFADLVTEHRSTSTVEGGKLDPNWLDFKEVAAQTSQTSTEFDLVQQVEVLQEATSLQDVQYNREVGCQKEYDEHVSDEEYFISSGDEK